MPYYENVFIARQDISATQAEGLADKFAGLIEAGGGTVTRRESWGLRNLAFRIRKNRKGHYTLLNIDAPPAAVKEMERNMRLDEDVLRYMTVRVDELDDKPSAMMRSRGGRDRDDRGGRDRDDRGGRDRDDRRDRSEERASRNDNDDDGSSGDDE